MNNSTLTRYAVKLIKSELIKRVRDESDRRILKLRITAKGIIERAKAVKISNQTNADVISGFFWEEIAFFSKILMSIIIKFDSNVGGNNEYDA